MFEECRSGSLRVKERHEWILKSSQSGAGRTELAGGRGAECTESAPAAATVAATAASGLSPGRRNVVRLDGTASRALLTTGGGRKGFRSASEGMPR